ncbi:hypothetical protein SAMN04490205_3590 [Pseudomonas trivialis]|uniref:Uncharacterized protein n=1 Tax=Pseudomonas trivialis TaxID=200450 RepID=A0A0R2ZD70_9PSED|nr:hypothetical protein TU79_18925 [Pseudomonas trivialis]SDS77221.1 hypothetical protein SAMN04490205_3590 [Pseudomonas trivialis]
MPAQPKVTKGLLPQHSASVFNGAPEIKSKIKGQSQSQSQSRTKQIDTLLKDGDPNVGGGLLPMAVCQLPIS